MKVYLLVKENFEGDTEVDVYATKEKAQQAFNTLKKKYRKYEDFEEVNDWVICWFDSHYNENSTTYVSIQEKEVIQ